MLPFQNLGPSRNRPSLWICACGRDCCTHCAQCQSLVVRPSSALMNMSTTQMDPLAIGHKLLVEWVLAGNFIRSEAGFDLNWQLLNVPGESVRAGGSISVSSFDLIAVQTEICNEVFASLQGLGQLRRERIGTSFASSRWQKIYRKNISRRAPCCRRSCRERAAAPTSTTRETCLKAW